MELETMPPLPEDESSEKRKMTPEEKAKKKLEKEHLERETEEVEYQKTWPVRIWMIFIWLFSGAVMLYYLIQIAQQLQSSYAHPGNTVTYETANTLPLPSITICNWNQLVPPLTSCPECELTLAACTFFGAADPNQTDCTGLWTQRNWNTPQGLFFCYEFNNDVNNILYSFTTGYAGSYATVWQVLSLPTTDPPTNRGAVQATFALQNQTTAASIFGEIAFAPTGLDTFFGLQLINTIHSELKETNPLYNVTRYAKTASSVRLLQLNNSTIQYAGVSFSFETLSIQYITFSYTYSLLNFFGDFAGMIGTLMGLDAIKVSMGIPTAIFAIKTRSTLPLEDLFNG